MCLHSDERLQSVQTDGMPVKHPRVAVLMAAFNGMQWIEEQLASILAQAGVDLTIYISIDLSSDGTESWCETYARRQPRVNVLPPAGTFGGASCNFFRLIRDVELAGFDLVAFADQDDIWHNDKLQRAARAIEQHGVDGYSSNVTAFWANGKTQLLNKAQAQVEWDYLFEAAGPGCTYVLSSRLAMQLKKSILGNWHEVQKVSLHDWYCYAFARSQGFTWFIDPEPTMMYRQHEHNQIGANTTLRSLVARYRMVRSGWWFSQVRCIAGLVGLGEHPLVPGSHDSCRWQLMKLSLKAWSCRRRVRDKVFFFCLCGAGVVYGWC
jgi:rhamnosyltransferase